MRRPYMATSSVTGVALLPPAKLKKFSMDHGLAGKYRISLKHNAPAVCHDKKILCSFLIEICKSYMYVDTWSVGSRRFVHVY